MSSSRAGAQGLPRRLFLSLAAAATVAALGLLWPAYRYWTADVLFHSPAEGRIEFPSGASFPLNKWSSGWAERWEHVAILLGAGDENDLLMEDVEDPHARRFATLVIEGRRFEAVLERNSARGDGDGLIEAQFWVRPGAGVD